MTSILLILLISNIIGICVAHVEKGGPIPKIIFRTFEDPFASLNSKFKDIFNKTLTENPEYVQVYFTGSERDAFVSKYYPKYLPEYRSIIPGAYKSDLFNLMVLYRYGGIYNDLGVRYMQKISEVVPVDAEYVSALDEETKWLFNGFTAVYPGHPVIKHLLIGMVDNVHYQRYGCNHLDITGPSAITRMFKQFFQATRLDSGHFVKHHGHMKFTLYSFYKNDTFFDHRKEVLRNKFEGYREAISKPGSVPFSKVYEDRHVYASEQPDAKGKAAPARKDFNGNLVKVGDSFFFVLNNARKAFPDTRTFYSMGFEECMAAKDSQYPAVVTIPLGVPFTKNVYENHLAISSGVYAASYLSGLESVIPKLGPRVDQFIARHRGQGLLAPQFLKEVELQ